MDGFGKWFFFAIVCYCCCALCESLERSEWTRLMASPSGALFLPRLYIEIKLIAQTVLSIFRSAYSKRGYLQFNIKRASLAEYDNTVKWESETGIFFLGAGKVIGKLNPTVEEEGFAHFRIHSPFLLLLFHYFISIRQSTKGY